MAECGSLQLLDLAGSVSGFAQTFVVVCCFGEAISGCVSQLLMPVTLSYHFRVCVSMTVNSTIVENLQNFEMFFLVLDLQDCSVLCVVDIVPLGNMWGDGSYNFFLSFTWSCVTIDTGEYFLAGLLPVAWVVWIVDLPRRHLVG